jgi:hypothetical protein
MSMDSTPPSKDTIGQTGLKRKIQKSGKEIVKTSYLQIT